MQILRYNKPQRGGRGRGVRLVASLLILCFLLPAFPIDVRAAESTEYNYCEPGSSLYVDTLLPSEILLLLGTAPSEAERIYLDASDGLSLRYHSRVPGSGVSVYWEDGEAVTVAAKPYTYTAENGTTVTFLPKSASSGAAYTPLLLEGDTYIGKLLGLDLSEKHNVTVSYAAELSLSAEAVNTILNRAYLDGSQAIAEQLLYEEALADYRAATEAYSAYLDATRRYEAALIAYRAYLAALSAYEERVAKRKEYEEQYKKYEEDEAKYQTYLAALKAYNDAKAALDAELLLREEEFVRYRAYLAYLAEYDACIDVLAAIDSAFIYSATGKQMYATLMGPTVSEVVSKQDELIDYGGVSPKDIENAGSSTEVLRTLLTEYKALTTDEARFIWYQQHYTEVRDSFTLLYSSLRSLLANHVVRGELKRRGKYVRYCEFVSHLYVISTCLDDDATTDPAWTINEYALYDILESEYAIADRNASDPLGVTFPAAVPECKEPVIETVLPEYPSEVVSEPLRPTEVPEAGDPPEKVEEPVEPLPVPAPGDPPTVPYFSESLLAVMAEIRAGRLSSRPVRTESLTLTVTATSEKGFFPEDLGLPVVSFYRYDGTLIEHILLTEFTDVGFGPAESPDRPSDARYRYTFIGWGTQDGRLVDFTAVTEDISVYPIYKTETIYYTVTWVTASGSTTESLAYGEMPQFTGDTSRPIENGVVYTFAGWDPAVTPVTGDVTYTARYTSALHPYTVKWQIGESTLTELYFYGETPTCPVSPEALLPESKTHRYTFVGWDKEIDAVYGDVTYTAQYAGEPLLPAELSGGEILLEVSAGALAYTATVPSDAHSLELSRLTALAREAGKGITLAYEGGVTVEIPADVVAKAPKDTTLTFSLLREETGEAYYACLLVLSDREGNRLSCEGFRLCLSLDAEKAADLVGRASSDGETYAEFPVYLSDDRLVLIANGEYSAYRLVHTYGIQLTAGSGGRADLSHRTAAKGETVTLSLYPDSGYTYSVRVLGEGGTVEIPLAEDGKSFVMPDGAVSVEVVFEKQLYTVSFYVDGVLYAEGNYRFGEMLALPADPEKAGESGRVYTFSGWSPSVIKTVIDHAEYHAVFKDSVLAGGDDYHVSPHTSTLPVKLIAIASTVLLLMAGGAVLLVRYRRKRRRSKEKVSG